MARASCRCTGGCGSRWCIGYMTWGKHCNVPDRAPHPATGQPQTVRHEQCTHCRQADKARQAREARTRRELAHDDSDGLTPSLFT